MTWPALLRETTMTIKIVKKGSFNAKPVAGCPFMVDNDGVRAPKK